MKRPSNELIYHGIVGGILAGLVVVLWFFVVDWFASQPFRTPAALASAIFDQRPEAATTLRLATMYTVLHFGVFALLGVGAAWLMVTLHTAPRLLLGVVFGIVVQELIFYAVLFLSGVSPSGIVPWQHVIGANLVSGVALMAYLHRASHSPVPLGLASLKDHPLLSRGLMTGVIGAAAVAIWFLLLDLAAGQPMRTPAALGSALLAGSNAEMVASLAVVAAYTVVHVIAFAFAGVIFVMIAEQVERTPSFILLAVLTAIVLEAVVVTSLVLGAQWALGTLGIWSMFVANLIAVGSMGWYVWQTHPALRYRLRSQPRPIRV